MDSKLNIEQIEAIINKLPDADYTVTVPVFHIEENLDQWSGDFKSQGKELVLIPDFQRGMFGVLSRKNIMLRIF